MLESYIAQVRRPKGVSSEREAFVSRAAKASTAACDLIKIEIIIINYKYTQKSKYSPID